jgi:uncharacterized membrane protein
MVSEKLVDVIVLSLLPFVELRLGIPAGIAAGLNPLLVYIVACGAEIALIPVLFWGVDHVLPWFERFAFVRKNLERIRLKAAPYVRKYGFIGLAVFVAIPIPGTGVWTGTIAADLLNVPREKAVAAIAWGALAMGAIMTAISLGVLPSILALL